MKIPRKAISFGVVAWETLSKTYSAADPSQNSNDITKGKKVGVANFGKERWTRTVGRVRHERNLNLLNNAEGIPAAVRNSFMTLKRTTTCRYLRSIISSAGAQ